MLFAPLARGDRDEQTRGEMDRLAGAGVTDVVPYPSSDGLDQVRLPAEAVGDRR